MCAQLIKVELKPGADLTVVSDLLKSFEQPGSGLIREIFARDQKNPNVGFILALFESEEKAREREADPRRAAGQQKLQSLLADVLVAPPDFVDLAVTAEWGGDQLGAHYRLIAVRAYLHERAGDTVVASELYDRAAAGATNAQERDHLTLQAARLRHRRIEDRRGQRPF